MPTTLETTNGITYRSNALSEVYARGDLIAYAEATDADFDLIISLKHDWNSFFKNVALPCPSEDDTDASGNHDASGATYYDWSMASGNIKLPRDELIKAMDRYTNGTDTEMTDELADLSGGFNNLATYWATATDYNTDNYLNGMPASHMQSVAKGLIGLFSTSAEINSVGVGNVIVEERDQQDGTIAGADSPYEIRIDRTNLLKWMSQGGGYGSKVMTADQLQELLEAAGNGRYYTETSDPTLDRSTDLSGHRVLALRQGDCLQVRIRVHDNVGVPSGTDVNRDNGNHRDWLLSFEQSADNRYKEDDQRYLPHYIP